MNASALKIVLCALSLAICNSAPAQTNYPSQPVKVVVGFAPGGSTDQVARIIADGMAARLNQSFVVENRPGASGNLAAGQVARAHGDGYTLLLSAVGLATTAAFNPEILQAHPTQDLAPVALLAYTPNVLLASDKSGFKSVADVIEYGKKNPDGLSFGQSGYGGGLHLTGEIFSVRSGVKMTQVPYKGVAPMMQDLLAGHINIGWDNLSTALPVARSGKVRALAIAAPNRSPEMPDVPTFEELGYKNMDFGAWFGMHAPKSISPKLAKTLSEQLSAVLDDEKVRQRIAALGIQIIKSKSPEAFLAYVDSNITQWKEVVDQANVKLNK